MTPPLSIYINDMENGIIWNVNSFADDTSLFSIVTNPSLSAFELNSVRKVIENWAYQWKTLFNPDPSCVVFFRIVSNPGTILEVNLRRYHLSPNSKKLY